MAGAISSLELERIENWLLAILRFAITQDETDRIAMMAAAANMDRPGKHSTQSDFSFFVRTSKEISDLIAGNNSSAKIAALRQCVRETGNERLWRALEAVLEIARPATEPPKRRHQYADDLWRGLPIRQ
jgi:hypothetical protein